MLASAHRPPEHQMTCRLRAEANHTLVGDLSPEEKMKGWITGISFSSDNDIGISTFGGRIVHMDRALSVKSSQLFEPEVGGIKRFNSTVKLLHINGVSVNAFLGGGQLSWIPFEPGNAMAFSSAGSVTFIGGLKGDLLRFDAGDKTHPHGRLIKPATPAPITRMALGKSLLATSGGEATVRLFDPSSPVLAEILHPGGPNNEYGVIVETVAWGKNNTLYVQGRNFLSAYSLGEEGATEHNRIPVDYVNSEFCMVTGDTLVASASSNVVHVRDAKTLGLVYTIPEKDSSITALAMRDNYLVAGTFAGDVRCYDVRMISKSL